MILIIDTDQGLVPYTSIKPDAIKGIDGTVFLRGTFREVGITEYLQYQVEKAVLDASDYHRGVGRKTASVVLAMRPTMRTTRHE